MLKTGDKIKYVKANSFIEFPIGTIFTVTDVQNLNIAVIGEYGTGEMKVGIKGVMSYDEYEKYFEKVVEEPKPTWTEWRRISEKELWEIMNELKEGHYIINYLKHYLKDNPLWYVCTRNNGKKTDVELTIGLSTKFRSTSSCNKYFDDFDESKGIQVALIKTFPKIMTHFAKCYITNTY